MRRRHPRAGSLGDLLPVAVVEELDAGRAPLSVIRQTGPLQFMPRVFPGGPHARG